MLKDVLICALLLFVFYTCNGQNKKTEPQKDRKSKSKDLTVADSVAWSKRLKVNDYKTGWVDSEVVSQGVIIQNSLPKGSPQTDSMGKTYGVGVFWSRVINETNIALELTINFPVDSLEILSSTDAYLKIFLLPDTMTLEKVPLYNYGVTSLRSLLDFGLNSPTKLQRTIKPKEEYLFYIAAVRYNVPQAPDSRRVALHQGGGVLRTGFVLKDQKLFYRINIDHDSVVKPCGQLVFYKE
jgi:hypothetical protein